MHGESMMDENKARAAAEALEVRIVQALEAQPEVDIAADFAARVASRMPVREVVSVRKTGLREVVFRETHYGRSMMVVGMVVLIAAMLALAPRAAGSVVWVGMEWTLCAQFVLLALWFVMRREDMR